MLRDQKISFQNVVLTQHETSLCYTYLAVGIMLPKQMCVFQ